MATTTPEKKKPAAKKPAAEVDSANLAEALVGELRKKRDDLVVEQKVSYQRVVVDGKTVAYLNGGKRALTVDVPIGHGAHDKIKVADKKGIAPAVRAIEKRIAG